MTAAAEKNFMMLLPAQKFCEAETYKKCCIFLGKGAAQSGWTAGGGGVRTLNAENSPRVCVCVSVLSFPLFVVVLLVYRRTVLCVLK